MPVVKIPERYAYLFRLKTEIAAMARPSDQSTKVLREKSVDVTDCGASQTITCSLVNCKDVMENVTIIETANGEESMISNHVCTKTYFVRNRMGDLVTITVTALFMKGLPQDLLGGKSVNRENIRVILDSDHNICGLYPLDKNHEQHNQASIEFIEEQTDLYYLQTEDMYWTTYDNLKGYDLWHHRLGHGPNRNIERTIQYSIWLENLVGKKCKQGQKCLLCMLGKSTLENYPGSMDTASQPLGRVHMDLYSSSITSIEGYNHSIILTDSNSGMRRQYGMKAIDATLDMSKRWFAETADVRINYPLIMVVRDNS